MIVIYMLFDGTRLVGVVFSKVKIQICFSLVDVTEGKLARDVFCLAVKH